MEKLLDLIDDVKEKLTSEEYKAIMEEMGKIYKEEGILRQQHAELYAKLHTQSRNIGSTNIGFRHSLAHRGFGPSSALRDGVI